MESLFPDEGKKCTRIGDRSKQITKEQGNVDAFEILQLSSKVQCETLPHIHVPRTHLSPSWTFTRLHLSNPVIVKRIQRNIKQKFAASALLLMKRAPHQGLSSKEEVKHIQLFTIREEQGYASIQMDQSRSVQRILTQHWMDRRKKVTAWSILGSSGHTHHCSKEQRDRYKQIYILKRNTDGRTRDAKTHTIRNSNQHFNKDTGLQPLVPRVSETDSQQQQPSQQQEGSRF